MGSPAAKRRISSLSIGTGSVLNQIMGQRMAPTGSGAETRDGLNHQIHFGSAFTSIAHADIQLKDRSPLGEFSGAGVPAQTRNLLN